VPDLRATFDQDAERYHRARPGYPPALFDDLSTMAGVRPGCRLLEIGPGTGKATLPLARRGCRIVAVELGANLAAVAARNLAGHPDVQVVVAPFETWPLPAQPFDVVLAATAWHWLDSAVRLAKAAEALRGGGYLAIVETHHVAGGTAGFFADVQACYERWDPSTPPGLRLPPADQIPAELTDATGRFAPAVFRRYEWEVAYTTDTYLDVLLTYSNHRALPDPARTGLLDCIADLIDTRYGGRIVKRYLTQLVLAERRASGE
jgi:SAM-dependent methyltransferase